MNNIIKNIEKKLFNCLDFDHIEDKKYIKRQLKEIRNSFKDLPIETTAVIENFIKMYVYPTIFDTNYFNFTRKDEFGKINEQGIFELTARLRWIKLFFLCMNIHSIFKIVYENTLKVISV